MRGQAFGPLCVLLVLGPDVGPVAAGALASLWSPSVATALTGAAVAGCALGLRRHLLGPRPYPADVSPAAAGPSGP